MWGHDKRKIRLYIPAMIPEYFTYVAVLLELLATSSYFIATLQGKARPNRVSWLVWTVIALIIAVAQWVGDAGLSALMALAVGIGPLAILILSFLNPQAYWQTSRLDIFCGVISALGLIGWAVTRNPSVAIAFCIFADFSASLPTYLKSWTHPASEDLSNYILTALSGIVAALAIPPPLTFVSAAFVAYLAVNCTNISVILCRKRIQNTASMLLGLIKA